MPFDPQVYGPQLASLLGDGRRADLGPGNPDRAQEHALAELLEGDRLAGCRVVDRTWANICRAALWLHFDFLDRSHQISQQIETSMGSYLHGIMHRREGDYGNAKYWFRQAGPIAAEDKLNQAARAAAARHEPLPNAARFLLEQSVWSAPRLVDLCEAVVNRGLACAELAREIQWCEWQILFDDAWSRAVEQPVACELQASARQYNVR